MGHESRIEPWSPHLTAFCFAGFGTDRLRRAKVMKTAGRENPNRWGNASSNRAPGAEVQNRSCSIMWAGKQEKIRPLQECFFLTFLFIELPTLGPLGQPEKAMGHESRIEPWSPHLTAFCFAGFGTDRLRRAKVMKTAGRENPNRWGNASSNRAHGAEVQNRSCSIMWAGKQEKVRPLQECFFLTYVRN